MGCAFDLGFPLDRFSIAATLIGSAVLLAAASLSVGNGDRLRARG